MRSLSAIDDDLNVLHDQESALFWGWCKWMSWAIVTLFLEWGVAFGVDKIVGRTGAYVTIWLFAIAEVALFIKMGMAMHRWWPYGMRRSRLLAERRRAEAYSRHR